MLTTYDALLAKLGHSEKLAKSSVFVRWLHQPLKYPFGLAVSKWLFPAFHLSVKAKARTFFGTDMYVQLPAGLDIYLTHAKSHDSEIRLAKWMIRHLQSGQVFIDAGAHYGYFSLLADTLGCQVHAFEPTPATFALLKKNTPAGRVNTIQAGLSDCNDVVIFYSFKGSLSEYNSLIADQYMQRDWFKKEDCMEEHIQVLKLDEFCQEKKIIPDCIKIDVEGAEDKVIRGADYLLRDNQPAIIMEYHPGNPNGPHAFAASMLHEKGYSAHIIGMDGMQFQCGDIEEYFRQTSIDSDNLLFLKSSKIV
jgi:FkbM family methyltransferase